MWRESNPHCLSDRIYNPNTIHTCLHILIGTEPGSRTLKGLGSKPSSCANLHEPAPLNLVRQVRLELTTLGS